MENTLATDFLTGKKHGEERQGEVYADKLSENAPVSGKKYYIESYGCAMNFSDSEIVAGILKETGYTPTAAYIDADLVLINTCSIRENAEMRVRTRISEFKKVKQIRPGALIGVLGCMAERLKSKLLEEEKAVDIVVGPDAYRSLPALIASADDGERAVNVLLSREETYSDISPVRLNTNGIIAFISIMRGCDNMCSFCVVPFTRGRERSRDYKSIVKEAQELFDAGYREVTLLGQNVDSYKWTSPTQTLPGGEGLASSQSGDNRQYETININKGETSGGKLNEVGSDSKVLPPAGGEDLGGAETINFAQLLEKVALVNPLLRIRFSTSHPKDITDEVLYVMKKYHNICKYIHLPIQSGSTRILEKMNRTYTREWYKNKIDTIRTIIPECGISTDTISGFCSETEEDHNDTLSMMDYVKFDMAYMFKYSERPGTLAEKKYKDDVPEEVKARRLDEIIAKQMGHQLDSYQLEIGKVYEVLIENVSRRSENDFVGRNTQNKVMIFPRGKYKIGEYVNVLVQKATSATLIGIVVEEE